MSGATRATSSKSWRTPSTTHEASNSSVSLDMPLDSGTVTRVTTGSDPAGRTEGNHSASWRPVLSASRVDLVIDGGSAEISSGM